MRYCVLSLSSFYSWGIWVPSVSKRRSKIELGSLAQAKCTSSCLKLLPLIWGTTIEFLWENYFWVMWILLYVKSSGIHWSIYRGYYGGLRCYSGNSIHFIEQWSNSWSLSPLLLLGPMWFLCLRQKNGIGKHNFGEEEDWRPSSA